MFAKRCYILTAIVILVSLLVFSMFSLLKNINVDNFKPAFFAILVDASENNKKLDLQNKFIKQFCAILDTEDKVKILQVSGDSYLIYEGSPQSLTEISKSLNQYTKTPGNKKVSSYNSAIKKAVQHCLVMKKNGYIPSIIVIGSLENNGKDAIDWNTLPLNIKKTLKYMPDFTMSFLWAEPKFLDKVKVELTPILGENQLIISTEYTIDKVSRKILKAIGR